jgi:D-sedoheptulose 7-phosphate isomerase
MRVFEENPGEATMSYGEDYIRRLHDELSRVDFRAVDGIVHAFLRAREKGRRIFVLGNGGSAATASHFVNDLNKLASPGLANRFKAIALTDNVPLITAWANDLDFAECFCQQLENLLEPEDLVVGLSCKGHSKNIVRSFQLARQRGATTIGFVGFDGGTLKDLADHLLWLPENHYGRVEDAHHILCHIISYFVRDGASPPQADASDARIERLAT